MYINTLLEDLSYPEPRAPCSHIPALQPASSDTTSQLVDDIRYPSVVGPGLIGARAPESLSPRR